LKKIKSERWIIFFIPYILFTVACSCVSLIFPAHQILVIQVWYQISVVVWIFLAVTMVKLLIRLQKINKLITRGINERRRKS
jgi:hypothetical protein